MNTQVTSSQEINVINAVSCYCDAALISLDEKMVDSGMNEFKAIISTLNELRARVDMAIAGAKEREVKLNHAIQAAAVDRVVGLLNSGKLSVREITSQLNPRVAQGFRTVVRAGKSRVTVPYKSKIRYSDPDTGLGWSGRGRMPNWLALLCANGKTKEDFLVETVAEGLVNKTSDTVTDTVKKSEKEIETRGDSLQMQQESGPEMIADGLPAQAWPDANINFVDDSSSQMPE